MMFLCNHKTRSGSKESIIVNAKVTFIYGAFEMPGASLGASQFPEMCFCNGV